MAVYDLPMSQRIPVSPIDRVLLIAMFGGLVATVVSPFMVLVSLAALAVLLVRLALQRNGTGKGSKLMEGARRIPGRTWIAIVLASGVSTVLRTTHVNAAVAIAGAGAIGAGAVNVAQRLERRRGGRDAAGATGHVVSGQPDAREPTA
jgi:hypothetical protein